MGDLVNLNRARKARARAAKATAAAENRIVHGRSKVERDLNRAREEKAKRDLDGAKRED